MYEPSSVVPSEHDASLEPELVAAILKRMAYASDSRLLSFVPEQLPVSA
jgi:hypothetical protein